MLAIIEIYRLQYREGMTDLGNSAISDHLIGLCIRYNLTPPPPPPNSNLTPPVVQSCARVARSHDIGTAWKHILQELHRRDLWAWQVLWLDCPWRIIKKKQNFSNLWKLSVSASLSLLNISYDDYLFCEFWTRD